MSGALVFLTLLIILIVSGILYVKKSFSYWKRRGVPYKKPTFPLGNFWNALLKKKSFGEQLADLYNDTDEPFQGVFITLQPALLVRDPEIIKDIFIRDFQSFNHRGWQANVDVDPMANNILLQRGEKWKTMRQLFTPAFSSSKVKAMFETMVNCGQTLDKYIDGFANTGKSIEIREIFSRFALNVIASVAFGLDIDCIENPDCEFRRYGQKFFEPNLKNTLRFNLSFMSPALAKLFKMRFADKDLGEFMRDTFRQNLEYRENNNVVRKDFFQLLMILRQNGKIHDDDSDWTTKVTDDAKSLTLEEMTSQAFLFFAGGFESSSSTMSFCMYELAKHPEVQEKAYKEIIEVLGQHDGKLTYDAVIDMKYMGNCIDETLRLHPPFPVISRMCTKTYKIPETDVIIEEGTTLLFSAIGLQYDPKYYEQPNAFIPERYNDTQGKSFIEMPNLVFGEGPRNCIGIRFAKLQPKIAITLLLRKFRFELADVHKNTELKLNPACVVLTPINGVNLKVYRR